MATVKVGPWDLIDPSERDTEIAREAKQRSTYPWHTFLGSRLIVHFTPLSKMPKVPGSQIPSRGYAYGRTILIARGIDSEESFYILLHETAHHLRLTAKQKLGVMELLRPKPKHLPEDASSKASRAKVHKRFSGSEYWWRSVECHCDQHVQRFTKPRVRSPYAYRRTIADGEDARAYREIVMTEPKVEIPAEEDELEVSPEDGEPEPPPDTANGEAIAHLEQAIALLRGDEEEEAVDAGTYEDPPPVQ